MNLGSHICLEWHARRALAWLQAVASGGLVLDGDPFELPHVPVSTDSAGSVVAFSESPETKSTWEGVSCREGIVEFESVPDRKDLLLIQRFTGPQ